MRDHVNAWPTGGGVSRALPRADVFGRVRVISARCPATSESRAWPPLWRRCIDSPVTFIVTHLKNRIFSLPEALRTDRENTRPPRRQQAARRASAAPGRALRAPADRTQGLSSHISDAIMQVFGQVKFGDAPGGTPAPGLGKGRVDRVVGGQEGGAACSSTLALRAATDSAPESPAKAPSTAPAESSSSSSSRVLRGTRQKRLERVRRQCEGAMPRWASGSSHASWRLRNVLLQPLDLVSGTRAAPIASPYCCTGRLARRHVDLHVAPAKILNRKKRCSDELPAGRACSWT